MNADAAPDIKGAIDSFSIVRHALLLIGWCHAESSRIVSLELRPEGAPATDAGRPVSPMWLHSPDIAAFLGPGAAQCRFDIVVFIGPNAPSFCGGSLAAVHDDGSRSVFAKLGQFRPSAASKLTDQFFQMVATMPATRILEVGSRARSGITRRALLPQAARYTGCDILAGENVDIVCDAHALSDVLPPRSFDAMFAMSVVEHLLMPWKFAIELNRVLAPGAIGLLTTHQCWPLHDTPWDYWRFSDRAWTALFNKDTGFEIIGTAMGEPAYIIATDCHPATNFIPEPAGFLASNVLFRKTGETKLKWNVRLDDIAEGVYPV